MQISVVIPVYNEEKSVLNTVNNILDILQKTDHQYELILINDGSVDNTQKILATIDPEHVSIINHNHNMGYGASLKTGIEKSKFNHIAIIDADGTYPIDDFPKLLEYISEYDIMC